MAITSVTLGYVAGLKLYKNSSTNNAGSAVVAAAAVVYEIEIDNTANAAQDNYLKLYDSAVAITPGTTVPDYVLRIRQAVKRAIVVPDGLAFTLGIQESTVTAGGTGGAVAPGSAVLLSIVYA